MPPNTSLYCTQNTIGDGSGGGLVTHHELQALTESSQEVLIRGGADMTPKHYEGLDIPFLQDYFALASLNGHHIDLAHFYSGTFTATIQHLKQLGTKVTYTVPAHCREDTIKEVGEAYPYMHIKDEELWQVFSQGMREADLVIVPSSHSAGVLHGEGVESVEIIPHGTTIPKSTVELPAVFDVGYLGQVGPDKGLKYLIDAWSSLDYEDSTLIMAGPGTDALGHTIHRTTNGGRFHLRGFVESPSELYNDCSVYIQPSVTEGFGIEVLEAMAHGRPVIVTEGVGAKDLVKDGKNGFIVPIRDPKTIAFRIDLLKNNPQLLKAMGKAARDTSESYSWDRIRAKYRDVFSSV